MQTAGEVARAATHEAKTQADTPEMKDLGAGLAKMGHATADGTRHAADAVRTTASGAATRVSDATHHAAESVRQTAQGVKERVHVAREEVKVRAEAIGETGRRAALAPGRITTHVKDAARSWMRGLVTALVMGLVMAVFAILTLTVLTIALVVGLNALVGDPAGTFIVAGAYLVVLLVAFFVMRSRREAAARETARHMQDAHGEIGHVTAPVRSAFTGRGRAGF